MNKKSRSNKTKMFNTFYINVKKGVKRFLSFAIAFFVHIINGTYPNIHIEHTLKYLEHQKFVEPILE